MIFKGKYVGCKVSTGFYYEEFNSRVRLSHLCKAVGIRGELNDPEDLLGKRLTLRVVPKINEYQSRTYRDYLITRFHRLDKIS